MNKKSLQVGDLVYIADDFLGKDFYVINKHSPALIVSMEGNIVKTLIGDKIHKWLRWDLEGAIR